MGNEPTPTFMGANIRENIFPLELISHDGTAAFKDADGNEVQGHLFIKPEDGTVVFRQKNGET